MSRNVRIVLDENDFKSLVRWEAINKQQWNDDVEIILKDIWFYLMNKYIMDARKDLNSKTK